MPRFLFQKITQVNILIEAEDMTEAYLAVLDEEGDTVGPEQVSYQPHYGFGPVSTMGGGLQCNPPSSRPAQEEAKEEVSDDES